MQLLNDFRPQIFVPDDVVRRVVEDIERTGMGRIENFVTPGELDRMRSFCASAVEKAGGNYAGFSGAEAMKGSGLDVIARDVGFQQIFTRMYEIATGRAAPEVKFYQILRCLAGPGMSVHSLNFHYDSYLITALLPIEIPSQGARTGDLIMLPNTRRVRSTYLGNLVDKLILDNKMSQRVLRALHAKGWLPVQRIRLVPGDLYFFWGYRSVHTNEACDPGRIRATALFHYANPHAQSWLRMRLNRKG